MSRLSFSAFPAEPVGLNNIALYLSGGDFLKYKQLLDNEINEILDFYYIERVKQLNDKIIMIAKLRSNNEQ